MTAVKGPKRGNYHNHIITLISSFDKEWREVPVGYLKTKAHTLSTINLPLKNDLSLALKSFNEKDVLASL